MQKREKVNKKSRNDGIREIKFYLVGIVNWMKYDDVSKILFDLYNWLL